MHNRTLKYIKNPKTTNHVSVRNKREKIQQPSSTILTNVTRQSSQFILNLSSIFLSMKIVKMKPIERKQFSKIAPDIAAFISSLYSSGVIPFLMPVNSEHCCMPKTGKTSATNGVKAEIITNIKNGDRTINSHICEFRCLMKQVHTWSFLPVFCYMESLKFQIWYRRIALKKYGAHRIGRASIPCRYSKQHETSIVENKCRLLSLTTS